MNKRAITKYIKERGKIDMPDLQERFGLDYSDAIKILSDLENGGEIKYCDGYTYEYIPETDRKSKSYVPKDKVEAMYVRALWECIKANRASPVTIIRSCAYGYNVSIQAIEWMEEEGYVSAAKSDVPWRDVLISREDFIKKFGNIEDKQPLAQDDDTDFDEDSEDDADDDFDEDIDDENDEEDDDDGEDNDDDDNLNYHMFLKEPDPKNFPMRITFNPETKKNRRDYDDFKNSDFYKEAINKEYIKLQERKERILRELAARDAKSDENDVTSEIRDVIKRMPKYNAEDDTFSIKMNVSYPNGTPFRIKVVNNCGTLYLSDCGDTIEFLSGLNEPEELKSYLKKSCVNTPVCLVDNEVRTKIKNAHDLSDDSEFLFRVVNVLVTQEYFDMYYLSKELMHLSNKIFVRKDAKLLVKALLVTDKQVEADFLKKHLNIRLSTANGIIDALKELRIINSDGTKTEKITAAFIAYLKHLSDND